MYLFIVFKGVTDNLFVVFIINFASIRKYTKKFTALKIKITIAIEIIDVFINSFVTIHFLRNPVNGGTPPKFAMIIKVTHLSVEFFGILFISFCFDFLINIIIKMTVDQYSTV